MLKNIDIDWEKFSKYHDMITRHLPKDYTFGYVGNIWGKWASDDRWFYIEDEKGKRICSDKNCNEIKDLFEQFQFHMAYKMLESTMVKESDNA